LASKEDNPSPDMDAPAPENTPVPEEAAPTPEETPEAALSQETPPPAPSPARTSKKEKKFFGMGGTLLLLALLITGGAGAGGFYLYQEQIQFQNETLARISQLEAQLGALDTEADQTRQNQQLLDTLNQDLQQHKMDIDATLKAHQNSLATLDEDVLRLKDKVAAPALPAPVIEGIAEAPGLPTVPPPPESRDKDLPESQPQEEPSQKTQPEDQSKPFLDWMENFFAAIWDWFAGLFS